MPVDLRDLVAPAHTALVTQELQQGVVGEKSALPELAAAVARAGLLDHVGALVAAARGAGVRIVHCTAVRRRDGLGANHNARLFRAMARSEHPLLEGSDAAALAPEIGAREEDLVLPRLHGLSPFQGTELDSVLRNEGVTTIVGVGVSVNVAIQNLAFDAVNAAYQVVVPRDAVAGFPAEYVEMVFANTLGAIATLTTTRELLEIWRSA